MKPALRQTCPRTVERRRPGGGLGRCGAMWRLLSKPCDPHAAAALEPHRRLATTRRGSESPTLRPVPPQETSNFVVHTLQPRIEYDGRWRSRTRLRHRVVPAASSISSQPGASGRRSTVQEQRGSTVQEQYNVATRHSAASERCGAMWCILP